MHFLLQKTILVAHNRHQVCLIDPWAEDVKRSARGLNILHGGSTPTSPHAVNSHPGPTLLQVGGTWSYAMNCHLVNAAKVQDY